MSLGDPSVSPPEDDTTIPDDDALYRRVPHRGHDFWFRDVATGEGRPTSGVFMPDPDGLSVYRRSILHENKLSAVDVTIDPTTNAVVSVNVGDVRSLGLRVWNDAWPADSDGHARDVAHTLVKGLDGLGKNAQLRRRRDLAKLPSIVLVYPVG
jgi:hypothetical protein